MNENNENRIQSNFIKEIIDADLKEKRYTYVQTRFPPEPNGYLHIGHAKSICLNFGLAQDYSSPMCLHLNRSPGVEESTHEYYDRFYSAFKKCSLGVQKRLVLENEDKGFWSCENLYNTFKGLTPFVYDNLHDECNPSDTKYSPYWAEKFKETWGEFTPVFHWSEGIDGSSKHTDYFSRIPVVVQLNPDVIWECEVKSKDFAICRVLNEFAAYK